MIRETTQVTVAWECRDISYIRVQTSGIGRHPHAVHTSLNLENPHQHIHARRATQEIPKAGVIREIAKCVLNSPYILRRNRRLVVAHLGKYGDIHASAD